MQPHNIRRIYDCLNGTIFVTSFTFSTSYVLIYTRAKVLNFDSSENIPNKQSWEKQTLNIFLISSLTQYCFAHCTYNIYIQIF